MNKYLVIIGLVLIGGAGFWFYQMNNEVVIESSDKGEEQAISGDQNELSDLIKVRTPIAGAVVKSPLVTEGEARGGWYFEASFPLVLVDWDGRIISEHYAEAQGEWMTEEFVPFRGELEFESPYKEGDPDFMKRGALILRKDNPSGLPEHDAAVEIPVKFAD